MDTKSAQEWDQICNRWAKGPADTEQQKCANAVRMVRDVITTHTAFKNRSIKVFIQGSYRNRTNVRMESDVDICVLCENTVFSDYTLTPGVNDNLLGFSPATYSFAELKQDVEAALVAKFGRLAVKRGNKAFDIKENTYRVAADVVPTFEGRLYYKDQSGGLYYYSGTVLQCDSDGGTINNWPEQHYANGVKRHDATNQQFKKKVRILKNLCNEMVAVGIVSAKSMASFLLESLVYNCPDEVFTQSTHYDDIKSVITYLLDVTETDEKAKRMLEVNNIKYLFHDSQPWKRADVYDFLLSAWNYAGFGS